MRLESINCSRCCQYKAWTNCLIAELCCWILPVTRTGQSTIMPMPPYDPENPPLLGFFMIGAYQEILGNMHNLFSDTAMVDVYVFQDGSIEIEVR
ncbi:MAG: hypothetical protein ACSLEN_01425 [Candidatus Malihini olakiniferum]